MGDAALDERIARLERRLERERAARAEAERIAEVETCALYNQARRLKLIEAVAVESNLSGAVDQVLASTLHRVCEFMDWPLGHVYLREDGEDGVSRLHSTKLWFIKPDFEVSAFRAESEAIAFEAGFGLPGQVMERVESVWVPNVSQDQTFPRSDAARACGLHAAFAFPVLIGSEVAAVFEFFLDREMAPDKDVLNTLDQIGAVLGRVIERDRAERRSEHSRCELRRAVEVAESASAAKTRFLAVTSHEVRTPLNAVLGFAEALSRQSLSADQSEMVEGIRSSGAMLLRLVNAVLDVAKIETGRVDLAVAPCDLASLASTIARVWRPLAVEAGVALELDLDGLPQPCWVETDAGKVEQTLINLIANALKFTPAKGRVRIRLSAAPADGRLKVRGEVMDYGPGVAKADRRRIFNAYEQTSDGRAAGGAGLGLAICAGNLEALDGQIGVGASQGRGSCFWFEFEAAQTTAPEAVAPEAEPDHLSLRVLAAEDNPANRHVLRLLLLQVGIEPVFAEDGEQAVALASAQAFDIILMDVNMPRMDGVEATRTIRIQPGPCASAPIYMLTANVFDYDRRRYLECGANGVISKPIVVPELYAALEAALAPGETEAAA